MKVASNQILGTTFTNPVLTTKCWHTTKKYIYNTYLNILVGGLPCSNGIVQEPYEKKTFILEFDSIQVSFDEHFQTKIMHRITI